MILIESLAAVEPVNGRVLLGCSSLRVSAVPCPGSVCSCVSFHLLGGPGQGSGGHLEAHSVDMETGPPDRTYLCPAGWLGLKPVEVTWTLDPDLNPGSQGKMEAIKTHGPQFPFLCRTVVC